MEGKVAVVTGAVSGIGLALTQDLLAQGWRIAMGDVNEAAGEELVAKLGSNVLFRKTDVSDWNQLAALFKAAHARWGRIDFHAANAGVGDIEAMYGPTAGEDGEPRKPNLKTVDIDLSAIIYGVRLSMHYFQRNAVPGGKIVVTSSVAGLYPAPHLPQYSACKHAVCSLSFISEPSVKLAWLHLTDIHEVGGTDEGHGRTTFWRKHHHQRHLSRVRPDSARTRCTQRSVAERTHHTHVDNLEGV